MLRNIKEKYKKYLGMVR